MTAVLISMVDVVLQYATDVNILLIKNLKRICGRNIMRRLCTENSVPVFRKNSSPARNNRLLTSVAYCTQGLHAVLVRVAIMCAFCSYIYTQRKHDSVSISIGPHKKEGTLEGSRSREISF